MATLTKCSECGYPLAAESEGQQVTCPMCQTVNEAIAGVTIPTPLFIGVLAFGLGVLLGPALIATTEEGRNWLAERARKAIRR